MSYDDPKSEGNSSKYHTGKPCIAVIVLSGPMTGLPDYNRPAFNAAADALRRRGHTVINPAQTDLPPGSTWGQYMGRCLEAMRVCDEAWRAGYGPVPILAQLPGWHHSRGAALEYWMASGCSWSIVDLDTLLAQEDVT